MHAKGKKLYQRRLLLSWILLTLGPILGVTFSEGLVRIVGAHLLWSYHIDQLKNSLFWHLAFWEWIGSAAVFLFLLSSAIFLPQQTGGVIQNVRDILPEPIQHND